MTVDVVRALKAEGYEVELVFLYSQDRYKKIPAGLPTTFLDAKRIFSGVSKLGQYLKEQKPSTLLTTQEHAHILALLARLMAKSNTRVVLRFGLPPSQFFKHMKGWRDRYLLPILARLMYPRADAVVGNSKHTSRELEHYGVAKERIHTIYNPLPMPTDSEKPVHPWLLQGDIPTILALGRLEPQKDFATLVRAYARASKAASSRLLILGEGGEYERLMALAKELGVSDSVAIQRGYVEKPMAYMEKAALFVLSSRYEGFPNVLIEAMAAETAVVATDCVSGPREILAPDTPHDQRIQRKIDWASYGALVPVGDVEVLAEAMTHLLTNTELRQAYAAKAKKRSTQFAMERILPSYKRVLRV